MFLTDQRLAFLASGKFPTVMTRSRWAKLALGSAVATERFFAGIAISQVVLAQRTSAIATCARALLTHRLPALFALEEMLVTHLPFAERAGPEAMTASCRPADPA